MRAGWITKILEAMRERAVRQVQEGESPDRSTVYGWLARYRRGAAALVR
jgi:hypothetical protein